jgi:hypothetical protein
MGALRRPSFLCKILELHVLHFKTPSENRFTLTAGTSREQNHSPALVFSGSPLPQQMVIADTSEKEGP